MIVAIAVVMACLLFPFGATTYQAHAAAKDTSADLSDAISSINVQLTQTVQSLQTLNGLGSNYSGYYTDAVNDYNSNIVDPINQWFSKLAYEEQQNIALQQNITLNNPNDQSLIKSAMIESYKLSAWVSTVADPNSIRSGSGMSLEKFSFDSDLVQGGLQVFTQFLSDNTGNCLEQLWNQPKFDAVNPITGQLEPPQPLNCPLVV